MRTCIWIVAWLLALTVLPGRSRPVRAELEPECAGTQCTYLPVVQFDPYHYVRITASDWVRGSSQYDHRMCYAVGGTIKSQQPVYDVQIEARFRTSTGQLVATNIGETALHTTVPGTLNAFGVSAPTHDCTFAPADQRLSYELVVKRATLSPPKPYRPVTIVSFGYPDCYPEVICDSAAVTLRNDNREPVSSVRVALWINPPYQYKIVTLGEPDRRLAPGESFVLHMMLDRLGRGNPHSTLGAEGIAVSCQDQWSCDPLSRRGFASQHIHHGHNPVGGVVFTPSIRG